MGEYVDHLSSYTNKKEAHKVETVLL